MSAEVPVIMQNPGDTRIPEGTTIAPAKKVTLIPIPIAGILLEWALPPKIHRLPTFTQADENAVLADTTT